MFSYSLRLWDRIFSLFACPGQLFFSYFPLAARHDLCFHSLSLISKISRWLPQRVSNALVGLLTLRLPSPGWVPMLLFSFLSAIFKCCHATQGWQPVPQCVSASLVCGLGGPSELLSRSNVDTHLRAECYIELNRLSRFTKAFPVGANS